MKKVQQQPINKKLLEGLRSMPVKQLKQELARLKISTDGVLEKEELVQRLYRATDNKKQNKNGTANSSSNTATKKVVSPPAKRPAPGRSKSDAGKKGNNSFNSTSTGNSSTRAAPPAPKRTKSSDITDMAKAAMNDKAGPEVKPLKKYIYIPENKRSVFAYQQGVKRKDVQQSHAGGDAANWSVPNFCIDRSASLQVNSRPVELWIFYDDDPIEIDEKVLRNNPNQGTWGYTKNVELQRILEDGTIRPKKSSLPIKHSDLIIVPPNEKPPKGLQCMGIWVQPVMKRDTSALPDSTMGFMEISGKVKPNPDIAYGVGGNWKLLGHNDELNRGKAVKDRNSTDPNRNFEIYIRKLWTNERFGPFACLPSTRLCQVKEKIVAPKLKIDVDDQRMSFDGTPVQDQKTLVGSGVRNGDTLDLGPMEVFVRTRRGKKYLFEVNPDEKVGNLKRMAEPKLNMPVREQRYSFKQKPMKDNTATLPSYGVKHRDIIDVEGMILFVVPLDDYGGKNKILELEVEPDFPISKIKQMVKNRLNMPVDEQRLCYEKKELTRGNSTLSDNSIKHRDTLTMLKDSPKKGPVSPKKNPNNKRPAGTAPSIPPDKPTSKKPNNTGPNKPSGAPGSPKKKPKPAKPTMQDPNKPGNEPSSPTKSIPPKPSKSDPSKPSNGPSSPKKKPKPAKSTKQDPNKPSNGPSSPKKKSVPTKTTKPDPNKPSDAPGSPKKKSMPTKPTKNDNNKRPGNDSPEPSMPKRATDKDPNKHPNKKPKPNRPDTVFVRDPTTKMKLPFPIDPDNFDLPELKDKVGENPYINKPPDTFQLVDEDTGEPVDPRRPPTPGTLLSVEPVPNKAKDKPSVPKTSQPSVPKKSNKKDPNKQPNKQPNKGPKKQPKQPGNVYVRDPTTKMKLPFPVDPDNFDLPTFKDKVGENPYINKPPDKFQLVNEDTGQPVDDKEPPTPGTTLSVEPVVEPPVPKKPTKKDPNKQPNKKPKQPDVPDPSFPVTVKKPNGEKIPIMVDPDDDIGDVKDKVAKDTGIPPLFDHVRLVDDKGDEPKDTERPIPNKTYKIVKNPEILVNVPGKDDPVPIEVRPNDTILDVKRKLTKPSGYPVKHVRLVDEDGNELPNEDKPQPNETYDLAPPEVEVELPGTFPKRTFDDPYDISEAPTEKPEGRLPVWPPDKNEKDGAPTKGRAKPGVFPKRTSGDPSDISEDPTDKPDGRQHVLQSNKPTKDGAPTKGRSKPGVFENVFGDPNDISEDPIDKPEGRQHVWSPDKPANDGAPTKGRTKAGAFPKRTFGDPNDISEDPIDKGRQHVWSPDKPANDGAPTKGRNKAGSFPKRSFGDPNDISEDPIDKGRQHVWSPDKPANDGAPTKGRTKAGSFPKRTFGDPNDISEDPIDKSKGRQHVLSVDNPMTDGTGGRAKLGLFPKQTIGDIKDALEDQTGVPKARQRIFFLDNDKPMKDDTEVFKIGIKHGSKLEMKEIPEITVKAPNGRTFLLRIDPEGNLWENPSKGRFRLTPTDTICDLKDLVENVAGVPKSRMRAFIMDEDGKELKDKTTLARAGLDGTKTIEFKLPDPLDIPIKHGGRTFHVVIDPDDTVANLREKARLMGIPIKQLRLVDLDGEEMIDGDPLEKYNVRNGVLVPEPPEIVIALPDAKRVQLSIMPAKTIGEIKDMIEEKTSIPKAQQRIFFLDEELDDDNQTFSRTKLEHGAVLKMNVEPDNLVTFKSRDGRTFVLDIEPEDTVRDVRMKLHRKVGFPIGDFRLGDLSFDDEDAIFLDLHPSIRSEALLFEPPKVEIYVPGIGYRVQLALLPTMTMRDVKKCIEEQVPEYKAKKKSRIFFLDNDNGVDDDTPLEKLKLENGMKLEIRDFQIEVEHYDGNSAILDVLTTEYIDDVKKKIKKALRVPTDQQNLVFRGRAVPEDLTLKEIGLGHNDIIKLEPMQIKVAMPNGKDYFYMVELDDTIGSLKEQISHKTRTPIDVQCITSGSTEFQDEQTLKECKVRHLDTVKMERFRVSVMDWEQETFDLDGLCPSDSIENLQQKIQRIKDLPIRMQKLVLDGDSVPGKGSLETIGIYHKTVLVLLDPTDVNLTLPESNQIKLRKNKVKKFKNQDEDIWPVVPDWSKRIFFFDNDDSIGDNRVDVTVMHWQGAQFKVKGVKLGEKLDALKRRISKAKGIPVKKQHIKFNGKTLDKKRTLRQQGVKHNSVLVLEGERAADIGLPELQRMSLGTFPTMIQGGFDVIVRHWSKNKYKMACEATDYLDDLKETIEKQLSLPVDQQRLTFNGEEIDETVNLKSQGISSGCVLVLEQMEIRVETPSGNELEFKVEADDTILRIKNMIFKKNRTPVNAQCIMFGGEELTDNKTLQECELEHEDILTMEEFSLSIMHWSGQVFVVSGIVPTDSIQDLKAEVQRVQRVPKKMQMLKFQGNILAQNKTLQDQGIRHRSVLILEQAPNE